jgi:phosphatidylinositol glycan class B
LAWEYDTGIRSSFQPWIAVGVFKIAAAFGTVDPFIRTFLLRSLTALLALLAVRGFVRATIEQAPGELRKAFILLSYFLWFLPFLHVRFSSESWSGIFLFFGLAGILGKRTTARLIWTGIAFGVAVLCRPPVGLVVLCALLWMHFIRKDTLRDPLKVCVGASAVALLGYAMDTAFYGSSTFSVWRYVQMGFMGNAEHPFDELPWYYYPPWVVKYTIPPIGIAILLAAVLLLWKQPKHLLIWCLVPYFLVHAFIPHKELRFLFPLADLVPLLLILGLNEIRPLLLRPMLRWSAIGYVGLCAILNVAGLAVVMTTAAGIGRTVLAKELHHSARPGDRIGYLIDPKIAWRIALPAFYRPENTEEVVLDPASGTVPLDDLDHLVARPEEALPLIGREQRAWTPVTSTESTWVDRLMRWYTWDEGPKPWTLYRRER